MPPHCRYSNTLGGVVISFDQPKVLDPHLGGSIGLDNAHVSFGVEARALLFLGLVWFELGLDLVSRRVL